MCGPLVPWDWIVLDVSFVLILLGGSMVLRARQVELPVWVAFGFFSAIVGGILFFYTYATQEGLSTATLTATQALTLAC